MTKDADTIHETVKIIQTKKNNTISYTTLVILSYFFLCFIVTTIRCVVGFASSWVDFITAFGLYFQWFFFSFVCLSPFVSRHTDGQSTSSLFYCVLGTSRSCSHAHASTHTHTHTYIIHSHNQLTVTHVDTFAYSVTLITSLRKSVLPVFIFLLNFMI